MSVGSTPLHKYIIWRREGVDRFLGPCTVGKGRNLVDGREAGLGDGPVQVQRLCLVRSRLCTHGFVEGEGLGYWDTLEHIGRHTHECRSSDLVWFDRDCAEWFGCGV